MPETQAILNSMISFRHLSLVRGILFRIFTASAVIVLLIAAGAYWYTYAHAAEREISSLRSFMRERIRTDSEIFRLAKDNLAVFAEEFLRLYHSDIEVSEDEFWRYYREDEEGAVRMRRSYFDGRYTEDGRFLYGLSSFIGNNQAVDDPDFQRRLVLSARVLASLGPAWVTRFANVHVAYPENAISLFYPTEPWGLNARADLPMNDSGTIKAVNKAENPERKGIWSGMYYDETAEKWMITYMEPVDVGDKHLITPAHDIYLSDMVDRLIGAAPGGPYNFIIRSDGHLVAHPSDPTDGQKWIGQLSLEKIDIPLVTEAYTRIQEQGIQGDQDHISIIPLEAYDSHLAVGRLDGPDWLLVRVLPNDKIRAIAHRAALGVLLEGVLVLMVILSIVYWVTLRQAEAPLRELTRAVDAIGQGDYRAVAEQSLPVPTGLHNEIGLLARGFVDMAVSIRDNQANLERVVTERTRELQRANAALKEMSLLDALTGIHNRRSLDRSLDKVFSEAERGLGSFAVMMIDIDFFKDFNDTYGHADGDIVLQKTARVLEQNIRADDRVFRYGGEEFLVIFANAGLAEAYPVAQRVAAEIRGLEIPHGQSPFGVITISAGLAQYRADMQSPEEIIRAADDRLYQAKERGRDQIISE